MTAPARVAARLGARRLGRRRLLALAAALVVALNLRAAVTSLSAVLPQVRDDLGLTRGLAGLLTTIPVLCFGVLAPASAWLGRRAGLERALALGMVALTAGIVLRSVGGLPLVLVGTTAIGAGMTVGNVLVPAWVKRDFPHRAGAAMSAYMAALTAGASLAGGVTAPVESALGWGWRPGLGMWALLAALAVAAVGCVLPRRAAGGAAPAPAAGARVWRSGRAWTLAGFMCGQSAAFYGVLAWLPAIMTDHGASEARASAALALFNVLGIATALAVPALAARRASQVPDAVVLCAAWLGGLLGLALLPGLALLWAAVLGLAQGAGIALVNTLMVLRASSPRAAAELSGLAQTAGYPLAAACPYVLGVLRDATGGWTLPLVVLLAVAGAMTVAATVAARPGTVA